MVHIESVSSQARQDLATLVPTGILQGFYLAGGTGLALHLGHRESIDLDFFSATAFSEDTYLSRITAAGSFSLDLKETSTVSGRFGKTLISLIAYAYPLLEKTMPWGGIEVASVLDIACMKLDAASTRGSKKDFIDLYAITHVGGYALSDLLLAFQKKFAHIEYNLMHIKKSLVYFVDAEGDPMPIMHADIAWEEVKRFFEQEVPKL